MAHQPNREPPPERALPDDRRPTPVEDPVTRLPSRRRRRRTRTGDAIWLAALLIVIGLLIWGWGWGFGT